MSDVQVARLQPSELWPSRRELGRLLEDTLAAVAGGRGAQPLLVCGPRGSGRRELIEWVEVRVRRDGLVAARADATGLDRLPALVTVALGAVGAAAEALVLRRPGASAVQSLRRRVATLQAAVGEGRTVPVAELSALVRLLGEATEEARAALVVLLAGLCGDGASRELLDAVRRGCDPNQPLAVVATCQVLRGEPEGWVRADLAPLDEADLDAALRQAPLQALGAALSPARRRAVLEATGGWPDLVRAALAALAEPAVAAAGTDLLDEAGVSRVALGAAQAAVQGWLGGPLSSPERRYLRAVLELAGPDGASLVDVGRALGDSTRFSAESSTLAALRTGLQQRGALFCPAKDRLAPAVAGLAQLLR